MARNLRVGVQRGLRQSIGGGLGTGDIFTLSPASFDFSRTNTKDSRITFSRASSGTFVGADGLIKTTSVNLIKYSQKFDQEWTTDSTGTITINHAEAPNGTTTANRFVESTGNSSHAIRQTLTVSGTYTVSAHFKELPGSAKRYGVLRIHGVGATAPIAFFDLGNGTVASSGGTNIISTSIADASNGWFRCSMTANEPLLSGDGIQVGVTNASDSFSAYAGDGSSGLLIWGIQVEEGNTATDYIPTTSTISGAPRFDHDPDTLESLGLLIEESRTNQLKYSGNLDNSQNWDTGGGSPSNTIAPDGTNDAVIFTENTATDYHGIVAANINRPTMFGNIAASVYIKPGTRRYVLISFATGGNGVCVTVDTQDMTISEATSYGTGFTYTNNSATIVSVLNGWYRVSFAGNASSPARVFLIRGTNIATGNTFGESYLGDGSTFSVWGAQLEEGSFPTSYIPTNGSTVTRAADVVEVIGTNFSGFYNQSEGTMFVDAGTSKNTGNFDLSEYSNGSINVRHTVRYDASNSRVAFTGNTVSQQYVSLSSPANIKAAATQSLGFAVNGVLTGNSGTSNSGTKTQLAIGYRGSSGGEFINGHIKRLSYFPTRLADATLQSITS